MTESNSSASGLARLVLEKINVMATMYNADRNADYSNLVGEVAKPFSALITHANTLHRKCKNAKTVFSNAIDFNLEAIAKNNEEQQDETNIGSGLPSFHQEGAPTGVPAFVPIGESESGEVAARRSTVGATTYSLMPLEEIRRANREVEHEIFNTVNVSGENRDEVLDESILTGTTHGQMIRAAHAADYEIAAIQNWHFVFELEQTLHAQGILNSVRRVITGNVEDELRSYTKGGISMVSVASGTARVSDMETQNAELSSKVVSTEKFCSFYLAVHEGIKFISDNIDSVRTVQRKLQENMGVVYSNGETGTKKFNDAVLAMADSHDLLKAVNAV